MEVQLGHTREETTDRTQRKIYVLDTNVLLFDSNAILGFGIHDIVIPIVVIEELDRFKKDLNDLGRNARTFSRLVDSLRQEGSLAEGVRLPQGGLLRVRLPESEDSKLGGLDEKIPDNRILQAVLYLYKKYPNRIVTLVTKDTNMRLKADALGIPAEDYLQSSNKLESGFTGVTNVSVSAEMIEAIYHQKKMTFTEVLESIDEEEQQEFYPNQFLIFTNRQNVKQTALTRFIVPDGTLNEGEGILLQDIYQERGYVQIVNPVVDSVWGLKPRNREQLFALNLLLDPNIHCVTLTGLAGTGKTLMAIAAGLSMTMDMQLYRRLVVSRPIFPMGRDLGFLPGDVSEKLNPWMKPIFDNLEFLLGGDTQSKSPRNTGPLYQPLLDQRLLEVLPLTYIRGRSITNAFIIIDEAQNLTRHELKTILTRVGEGTKIILTGDIEQIDNIYIDETSNGLTYAVEKFKEHDISGHITLQKGERSKVATLAAKIL